MLTEDSKQYSARPYIISGTCKREDVPNQRRLLSLAIDGLVEHTKHTNKRLYCVASDGDAKRRRATILLTLIEPLPPTSSIYSKLAYLRLFNILCGNDELTGDIDWKHILKRFRNTLLRLKGVVIDGIVITKSILKDHLMSAGMSDAAAEAVLDPNDRQDVVLMVQLLNSLAQLSPVDDDSNPSVRASRRVLRLLGQLYRNLLEAYMDPSLSLHEQLSRLSATAHLSLALYSNNQGDFIPVQLYFDTMTMIKNVYFCVAKVQVDNPDGSFWIILLGTDGLEKVFGKVRTMIGNDSHADLLQLANRIYGAVLCVQILEQHPDWGGQSRRITVKSLEQQGHEISQKMDHLNPRSWRGDVKVKHVSLRTAWQDGRRVAEKVLREALLESPFERMEAGEGFDIFCPFGGKKYVLINGKVLDSEVDEGEDEMDHAAPTEANVQRAGESSSELDLDDLADLEANSTSDVSGGSTSEVQRPPPRINPNVIVDGKLINKAKILRLYSSPFSISLSRDRLKSVQGQARYNESTHSPRPDYSVAEESDSKLHTEDPALTLVQSNGLLFLAVIRILSIRVSNVLVDTIPESHLHQPNVRIRAQIMTLVERAPDASDSSDNLDWEWNGVFEGGAGSTGLREMEGLWFEVIDPSLRDRTSGVEVGTATYAYATADLRGMAALLFERLKHDSHRLPVVPPSKTFPYRAQGGML